jgi:hypothetical protein
VFRTLRYAEALGRSSEATRALSALLKPLFTHDSRYGGGVISLGAEDVPEVLPTPICHPPADRRVLFDIDLMRIALIGASNGAGYAYSDQEYGAICGDVMPVPDYADIGSVSYGQKNWMV